MSTGPSYHQIPEHYCRHLGGLRWSASGDAVEHEDGSTFAFVPQLGLFLEGLASARRLMHFGFVLHLMHLLRPAGPQRAELLRKAFQEAGRPLRNAGAFFAELCKHVPALAESFRFEPHEWVVQSSILWFHRPPADSELPPLTPEAFEDHVLRRLDAYSPQELRHWLRHGRGPIKEAGERVVRIIREVARVKSRTLTEVLAELTRRERLAGAVPYVARLLSALALPPRRLARQQLPVGGYSDVATRGQPEQLLPSQFVLDDLEFVRRFAANELLFFRREEPHAQTKEELVLVLDQGVRTWGDVRLVLTAAVFALARRIASGKMPLRLAASSSSKTLDCRTAKPAALGELLEASDLTPHPAATLERVLEEPADVLRDIVLLTHPRNLAEADVQAAARRLGKNCRLFAASVDGHGQAQLAEVRRGVAVPLTRFRIDWQKAPQPAPAAKAAAPNTPPLPWQGDVEPIGFPFRFGATAPLGPFAFDASGQWLLVSGPNGMLHVERIEGGSAEVLPRGFHNGRVLNNVEAVLGVYGGFAVCGLADAELMTFHYDLASRTCTARVLGVPERWQRQWFYLPLFHAVVVKGDAINYGVDLATGERGYHKKHGALGSSRVQKACAEADGYHMPPTQVMIVHKMSEQEIPYSVDPSGYLRVVDATASFPAAILLTRCTALVCLTPGSGTVELAQAGQEPKRFQPKADGQPILKGATVGAARLCGDTLALLLGGYPARLRLFRLPEGTPLADFPSPAPPETTGFVLSGDGSKLARRSGGAKIIVHDLTGGGHANWVTPRGRYHSQVDVYTGDCWLAIHVGGAAHLLRWDQGVLNRTYSPNEGVAFVARQVSVARLHPGIRVGHGVLQPSRLAYDPKRFVASLFAGRGIVVDAFGQVIVLDKSQNLVCMFFTFRNQFAAWMPDGTRYGPASLTGGPETSGAADKIGQALLDASKKGARQ